MLASAGLAGGGEVEEGRVAGSSPAFVCSRSTPGWAMKGPLLPVGRDRRISDFPKVSKEGPSTPPWGGGLCPGGERSGGPLPAWAF